MSGLFMQVAGPVSCVPTGAKEVSISELQPDLRSTLLCDDARGLHTVA